MYRDNDNFSQGSHDTAADCTDKCDLCSVAVPSRGSLAIIGSQAAVQAFRKQKLLVAAVTHPSVLVTGALSATSQTPTCFAEVLVHVQQLLLQLPACRVCLHNTAQHSTPAQAVRQASLARSMPVQD